jgi:hypothetical protein
MNTLNAVVLAIFFKKSVKQDASKYYHATLDDTYIYVEGTELTLVIKSEFSQTFPLMGNDIENVVESIEADLFYHKKPNQWTHDS